MKVDLKLRLLVTIIIALLLAGCGEPPAETSTDKSVTVPVETTIVKAETVTQNVGLTGVIIPVNAADIISEVSGKVEKINAKLGDRISSNDTLAVVDDRIPLANYLQAKSQVLSAENNLNIAKINLQSDEDLFKHGDISKLAFENSQLAVKSAEANLLSAKANLSLLEKAYYDTRIMSPINGIISRKYINIGTMVNSGMHVYSVVDLSKLKIETGIAQNLIDKVQVDSKAEISFSGLNHPKFQGVVKHISPQADEATGVFKIEIHLNNTPDNKILAGMAADIILTLTSIAESISVPDHAIVTRNGDEYVYKIENNIAKMVKIKSGGVFGSRVLIDEGISEGDQIVVVGMKNLGIDTKVRVETVN